MIILLSVTTVNVVVRFRCVEARALLSSTTGGGTRISHVVRSLRVSPLLLVPVISSLAKLVEDEPVIFITNFAVDR